MGSPQHNPPTRPARLPPESAPPAFPDLLLELWQRNYTGRVTLHFLKGEPRIVEYQGKKRALG